MANEFYAHIRRRTYEVLEPWKPGDRASLIVESTLVLLIVLNVVAVILESVPSIGFAHTRLFDHMELTSIAIFTIEYLLRVWSSVEDPGMAQRTATGARLRFLVTPLAVIDLIAIAPFYLSYVVGIDLRVLRVLRVMRILKLTRYSPAINLLVSVFRQEAGAFGAALFILLIVMMFASCGIYLVEHRVQPEAFGSIPAAMWWAVSTLTTVGYGDVTPTTPWGKVFGACVTIVGIGMVALPSGLLASGFSSQLRKRRIEFQAQVRQALQDGLIDEEEARELENSRMDLGLSDKEAIAIRREIATEARHPQLAHCPHCGRPLHAVQ
jgi:voltage-gated potassium channel